jgi:hypothetical protein
MANNNDEYTFTPSSVDEMVSEKFYTVGSKDNERVSEFVSKIDVTEEIKKIDPKIKDNIKYYDLYFKPGRVVRVSDDPNDKDDVIKEAILKKQSGGRRRSFRKITVRKSRKNRNNNKSRRNSRKSRYSRRR